MQVGYSPARGGGGGINKRRGGLLAEVGGGGPPGSVQVLRQREDREGLECPARALSDVREGGLFCNYVRNQLFTSFQSLCQRIWEDEGWGNHQLVDTEVVFN